MSFDADLITLLTPIFGDDLFFDTTPDDFDPRGKVKFAIIEQVGGRGYWYVEKDAPSPSHKHARVQITVWGARRLEVNEATRQMENAIRDSEMIAENYGAPNTLYNEGLKIRGCRQDFGIWYPDP